MPDRINAGYSVGHTIRNDRAQINLRAPSPRPRGRTMELRTPSLSNLDYICYSCAKEFVRKSLDHHAGVSDRARASDPEIALPEELWHTGHCVMCGKHGSVYTVHGVMVANSHRNVTDTVESQNVNHSKRTVVHEMLATLNSQADQSHMSELSRIAGAGHQHRGVWSSQSSEFPRTPPGEYHGNENTDAPDKRVSTSSTRDRETKGTLSAADRGSEDAWSYMR